MIEDPRTAKERKRNVRRGKLICGVRGCVQTIAQPIATAASAAISIPLVPFSIPAIGMRSQGHGYDQHAPWRAPRVLYSSWAQMANEDFSDKVRAVIEQLKKHPPLDTKRRLIGKLYTYRDRMHRDQFNKRSYPRHSMHKHPLSRQDIQDAIDKYDMPY